MVTVTKGENRIVAGSYLRIRTVIIYGAVLFMCKSLCYTNNSKRKENRMGEKRDIQRIMEREIRKGSCPLRFERMEFQKDAYRPILSEQDLEEAFDYLLRLGKFRWYEEKTVINNIYMNYDVIRGNITMKRAKSYLERLELKNKMLFRAKKMKPDYRGGMVYTETAKCYFKFDDEELEKYKFRYQGIETVAFPMSDKYMTGLYLLCEEARRTVSEETIEKSGLEEPFHDIVRLTNVKDGIFKSLLLDDLRYEEGYFIGNMRSILVLESPLVTVTKGN